MIKFNMSKSTIRNIILSLVLIVTSVAIFGFMAYQITQQGSRLAFQIETLEKERSQEASRLKLKRTADETVSDREQLKSYFLEQESDSIDFLNKVESLAPIVGVKLQTSGLESVVNSADDTKWIQAEFSFSGSRAQIDRFIKILETLPLVLKIKSIEMVTKSNTEWQATVAIQVQVLSYAK